MPNPWADWIALSHSRWEHLLSISEARLITDPSDALSSPQRWGHFKGKRSLVSKIPGCWIILWHISMRAESAAAKAACCFVWDGRTRVRISLALALSSASWAVFFQLFSLALWSSCTVCIYSFQSYCNRSEFSENRGTLLYLFSFFKAQSPPTPEKQRNTLWICSCSLVILKFFSFLNIVVVKRNSVAFRLHALWQARWDYFVMDLISF